MVKTEKSMKKARKSISNVPASFVESLGIDVLPARHLLSFNKVDKKALVFGATSKRRHRFRGGSLKTFQPDEAGEGNIDKETKFCALCDFSSEFDAKFQTHIRMHRGENYSLQCKNCGMCFASEPSWKKHLFLIHRIKKPQLR